MNRAFFHCPGCNGSHCFRIKAPTNDPDAEVWTFNGNVDSPTFSPSLLCNADHPPSRCHLFVRAGVIEFLGDCFHELAGQKVEMEDSE